MVNSEAIINLIKEAGIQEKVIDLKDDVLLKEQGVDSLDMMNILLLIEEKYHISISDEDSETLLTIQDIVIYLNKKLNQ